MARYELILPSMGEGVMEATITNWLKNVGDTVAEDETVVEIATDKVDSDVPSPVSGKIVEILVAENEIAQIEQAIAILEIEGEEADSTLEAQTETKTSESIATQETIASLEKPLEEKKEIIYSDGFLSPLVKSILDKENISSEEIKNIVGSGAEGRITKDDVLKYLASGKVTTPTTKLSTPVVEVKAVEATQISKPTNATTAAKISVGSNDEIIEMDRMRKLIAQHMINSKQTSPHVTSFVETDMTKIVLWRNKIKDEFLKKEGEKLTFMPILVYCLAKTIKDFPMINVSVDGDNIIKRKNINIGMATALPSGNLIVPVIKNADELSLSGLAKKINDLAKRARENNLKPDEIQGGTYTLTNIGSFGNILGTPIINQPQVAIMAVGAIEKKPAVVETPEGDVIAIRHKMYLSHAYDHRVVDGALGGMFVKRFSDYLESFEGI